MIPKFKIERVNNLLGDNNISGDAATLDKSSLGRVDDVG
jgi:hypothetical protein